MSRLNRRHVLVWQSTFFIQSGQLQHLFQEVLYIHRVLNAGQLVIVFRSAAVPCWGFLLIMAQLALLAKPYSGPFSQYLLSFQEVHETTAYNTLLTANKGKRLPDYSCKSRRSVAFESDSLRLLLCFVKLFTRLPQLPVDPPAWSEEPKPDRFRPGWDRSGVN